MDKKLIIDATNLVGKFASFHKSTKFVTIFSGVKDGKLCRPWTYVDSMSDSKESAIKRLESEWKQSCEDLELHIFKCFDVNQDYENDYNETMIEAHKKAGITLIEIN